MLRILEAGLDMLFPKKETIKLSPITVIAGAILSDGKILITRRAQGKSLGGFWEFPGGKLEKESEEQALIREIKEELSLNIAVKDFIADTTYDYHNFSIYLRVYSAVILSGEIKLVDHDMFRWVAKDQLKDFNFAPADIPIIKKMAADEL